MVFPSLTFKPDILRATEPDISFALYKKVDLSCTQKIINYNCIELVAHNKSIAEATLLAEAGRLNRFDAILDKAYQQPYRELTLVSDVPQFLAETKVIKLAIMRIALEIAQGKDEEALARWGNETNFLLKQAKNSYGLIDKMAAIAGLNRYQYLLADYISYHPNASRGNARKIMAMLVPFNKEAVTLQFSFENEATSLARSMISVKQMTGSLMLDSTNTPDSWVIDKLFRPFLDPNATANAISEYNLEWSHIATLEENDLQSAIKEKKLKLKSAISESIPSLVYSYHNPVGKILVNVSKQQGVQPLRYLWRSNNTIANNKLLVFAIDLLSRAATPAEQIQQEINIHKAELKHPYTAELPVWNGEGRSLSYPIPEEFKEDARLLVVKL